MKLSALLLLLACKKTHSALVVLTKQTNSNNATILDCPKGSIGKTTWKYTNPAGRSRTWNFTGKGVSITSLSQVGKYDCRTGSVLISNYTVAYLATPVIPVSIHFGIVLLIKWIDRVLGFSRTK